MKKSSLLKGIRQLPNAGRKVLYLTFDDGPDAVSTPLVLKVLDQHHAKATFFVIQEKAKQTLPLLKDIQSQGHAIGNHSLDHGYSQFFRGKKVLREWILAAESSLQILLDGAPNVGFRPPAGITPPPLLAALQELNIPLVLWKIRFFDLAFPWSKKRALKSLERTQSGDIILLHDCQSAKKLPGFLQTLSIYLEAAQKAGFQFKVLTRDQLNH